ncbi:XRE family transcriptional regulator [Parasaccharibacter sp. TMW 2.1884]|nr:XRE family transcriptional regulator [Parasaccharibacter sp. TMW 2.1884]
MESAKIKFLLAATGLSLRQAGELLRFSTVAVKSWCAGIRTVPPGVIDTLCEYHDRMRDWAAGQQWPVPDVKTDEEAREHGFLGVNSYRIAASMVFFDNF